VKGRTMESGQPTVVLVPGAWHGPWVWNEVRRHLDTAGIPNAVVDLPSVGDRVGGVFDDAEAIRSVLNGPTVLVAHSYGGIPATQAAATSDEVIHVVHVVYVCAFAVPVGTSLLERTGGSPVGAQFLPDNPRANFYGECAPAVADRAVWRLRPQSVRSARDPLGDAAYGRIPATYVVCERDAVLPVAGQLACAAVAAADAVFLDTDHSPMLSRPAGLAAILSRLAVPAVTR
jgi:pimeloyl-ACP methyl ester carboxylesterase